MRFFTTVTIPLFLVLSCATPTKDKAPPPVDFLPPHLEVGTDKDPKSVDNFLKSFAAESSDPGIAWWVAYRRANLWAEKNAELSCQLYSDLARDPLFPLQEVAGLRALELCGLQDPLLDKIALDFDPKSKPWLADLHLSLSLKRAEASGSRADVVDLLIKKSKEALIREVKVGYVQKALKEARKLKNRARVVEIRKRLYKLAPRLEPNPKTGLFLDVAADFRSAREFEKSEEFYMKVLTLKNFRFQDKLTALVGLSNLAKLQRRDDLYLTRMRDVADFVDRRLKSRPRDKETQRLHFEHQIKLARALWTLDQFSKSKSVLDQLVKRLGRYHPMAEVYWLRGRMLEEQQNFSGAIWWFEKALSEGEASEPFKEKIRWYLAWNFRKTQRPGEAKSQLDLLIEKTGNTYDRARYQFWLARTLQEMNLNDEAQSIYSDLKKSDPLGYYGILAHKETNAPLTLPNHNSGNQRVAIPKDLSKILERGYVGWLISVSETDLARRYLDYVSGQYRELRAATQEGWLSLFQYYAQAGEYNSLFTQLGTLDAEKRMSILENHPEIIFPRPFNDYVSESANRFGILPEYIYSIMRQESSFNPRARSHMDAFGLMQLLPSVAKASAEKNQIPFQESEDLYDPGTNIQVGSAYLRELWDKYNGQFILATASYNASEKAIQGWLKTRFRGDSVEFIEDIPYEETRGYVKLVMRNLIYYSLFAAKGGPLPFPEWTLEIEDQNKG